MISMGKREGKGAKPSLLRDEDISSQTNKERTSKEVDYVHLAIPFVPLTM